MVIDLLRLDSSLTQHLLTLDFFFFSYNKVIKCFFSDFVFLLRKTIGHRKILCSHKCLSESLKFALYRLIYEVDSF